MILDEIREIGNAIAMMTKIGLLQNLSTRYNPT